MFELKIHEYCKCTFFLLKQLKNRNILLHEFEFLNCHNVYKLGGDRKYFSYN